MRLGKKVPPYPILNRSINMSSYNNSNFSFSYELEETKEMFINGIGKHGEELVSLFDINAIIDEHEIA